MRDVYEVDAERLLLVATDRVSAFDVVMREPVPHKGAVLTQLTAWWLHHLGTRIDHHLISADPDAIVAAVPALAPHRALLVGRAMLVRRTTVYPVECVIRGYVSGSAWKEYQAGLPVGGERLRPGLRESDRLEPARFTPATKAEHGHDENISTTQMAAIVGASVTAELERRTRIVYDQGRAPGRRARDPDRGYETRVRPHRRPHPADRRSADSRQLALLARRGLHAGTHATEFRQAAVARLSRCRAARGPLERRRAGTGAATGGRRGDECTLPRRVPPADGGAPCGRSGRTRRMNFAREGYVFIAIAAVLAAAALATALARRSWPIWLLAFVLALLTLWVAYFFRDPERIGDRGDRLVIAPADGRVVMVTDVDEPMFFHGPARRISIFMNVFNVHVNRYPVSGTVRYVHYNPGKFLNAAAEKSSLENEQRSVGIAMTGDRRVLGTANRGTHRAADRHLQPGR